VLAEFLAALGVTGPKRGAPQLRRRGNCRPGTSAASPSPPTGDSRAAAELVTAPNVEGVLEGIDPALEGQYLLITAPSGARRMRGRVSD